MYDPFGGIIESTNPALRIPLGDAGGDPDWYGYCLDDPVNGVGPLGLHVYGPAPAVNAVFATIYQDAAWESDASALGVH